jgi:branched-chain amino acid transport system substrate-binding protein
MIRRRGAAAVCLLGVMMLAACSSSSTTSSATQASSKAPFKIGAIMSLTGQEAAVNLLYYHDTQLLVSQFNAHGGINGHPIEVKYTDDQSNPTQGVLDYKELVSEGYKVILGPIYTAPTVAVAALAQQQGILMFSPGSIAPQLTTPTQKWIFAAYPTASVNGTSVVNMMVSQGFKKPGVIVEDDTYGHNAEAGTKAALSKQNLTFAASTLISNTSTDATSQVLAMKNAGVDVIIGAATDPVMRTIYQAENQQGINIPIIAFGSGPEDTGVLTTSDPVEAYLSTPLACQMSGSCVASYLSTYTATYPTDSQAFQGPEGYAAIDAFFTALKYATGSQPWTSPSAMAQAMETAPAFKSPLVPGTIKWTQTNHLGMNTVYFEGFKGGKLYFFGGNIHDNTFTSS